MLELKIKQTYIVAVMFLLCQSNKGRYMCTVNYLNTTSEKNMLLQYNEYRF